MKYIENEYNNIFTYDNLMKAHKHARKGKRYRDEILNYSANLEENLMDLEYLLLNKKYTAGKYRKFYVYEPKVRRIMALNYQDRIVQWALYSLMYPFFDTLMIEDTYACRRGKGREKCANKLDIWLKHVMKSEKRYYYLKLDISKYFYRIDHDVLLNILGKRILDKDIIDILDMYINCESTPFGLPVGVNAEDCDPGLWLYDVGIPIGNLLSQLFANIYLNELDQFCKHIMGTHYYIRYMDDIIILSNDKEKLNYYLIEIDKFLTSNLYLSLNKKTTIDTIDKGISFIGYRFYGTHKVLRKSTKQRMIRSYKYLSNLLFLNEISPAYYFRVTMSYNGLMSHSDSYQLRLRMNDIYFSAMREHYPKKIPKKYVNMPFT